MPARFRSTLPLLVLVLLGACAENRWLPLSGQTIQAEMFGKTALGTDAGGGNWTMWIAPDGKAVFRGSNGNGTELVDNGTARIDGDSLCVQWQKMHADEPFCQVIYTDRGLSYRAYSPDLTLNSHFTLVPGNPDKL
ncbi:MAG TPA: hypothetical protein VMB34_25505 [Acetobacteraceae bacterium]|nr:hypothetical protein [Acetobacteraceae bacterium]